MINWHCRFVFPSAALSKPERRDDKALAREQRKVVFVQTLSDKEANSGAPMSLLPLAWPPLCLRIPNFTLFTLFILFILLFDNRCMPKARGTVD